LSAYRIYKGYRLSEQFKPLKQETKNMREQWD
jgi:fibronectin type 3 domain-containing protein